MEVYDMLTNLSLEKFVELVGSTDSSVPAGGSTAAANGLFGIALLKLVYGISRERWDKESKNELGPGLKILDQAAAIFLKDVDRDAAAFKLNQESNFEDQELLKELVIVPMEIALTANKALKIAADMKDHIIKKVQADYEIAVLNLKTTLTGSLAIIESNLSFFDAKSEFIKNTKEQIDSIKNESGRFQ